MKSFLLLLLFTFSAYSLELGVAHQQKISLPSDDWEIELGTEKAALELRLINIEKVNEAYIYNFEIIANEVGRFNVMDFLRSPQNSDLKKVAPLWLEFTSSLPKDFNGELIAYDQNQIELKPWYQSLTRVLIAVWFLGLILIIFVKKKKEIVQVEVQAEVTLADFLLERLEQLNQGKSSKDLWQELELSCIQFCREHLQIKDLSGAEVFERLKEDDESGKLIKSLEKALHAKEKLNLQSLLNQIRRFTEERR